MEKMKLKIDYSVYLVTDTGFLQGRDFAACIEAALKGGVTLLQYREKMLTVVCCLNGRCC